MRIIRVVVLSAALCVWHLVSAGTDGSGGGTSGNDGSTSDDDVMELHSVSPLRPDEVSTHQSPSSMHTSRDSNVPVGFGAPALLSSIITSPTFIDRASDSTSKVGHHELKQHSENSDVPLPTFYEKGAIEENQAMQVITPELPGTTDVIPETLSSVPVRSSRTKSRLHSSSPHKDTTFSETTIPASEALDSRRTKGDPPANPPKNIKVEMKAATIESSTTTTKILLANPDVPETSLSKPVNYGENPEQEFDPTLRVLRSIHPSSTAYSAHAARPSMRREATAIDLPPAPTASERNRGGGGNPSIDNILSGIMQLLGGDINLPRPPSLRLPPPPPLPPPSHHKPPSRINNRGPPNFNFPPPPPRPPQPQHHPPRLPHPHHGRPMLPHLPPPHPGHFDTIPRLPPPNFHFPPMNHPNHPQHPQQHIHIVPLPHPPTVYPTPSEVSHLLGLNEQDRQQQQYPPPMEHGRHTATPALSEVAHQNGNAEVPIMHRETVRDDVSETSTEQLPTSKSTIVLIHEGPVTSTSEGIEPTRPLGSSVDGRPPETAEESRHSQVSNTNFSPGSENNVPSGPVSGWLPVFLDSSNRHNGSRVTVNPAEEPEIITEPTEPSVFDITVVHSIGTVNKVAPSKTKQPSFETASSAGDLFILPDQDTFELAEAKTEAQTVPTETHPSRTAAREPEVIYGTPTIEDVSPTRTPAITVPHTSSPSNGKESDVMMTLSGKGTLTPEMTHTRAPVRHQPSATGRPIVIPVEIEDVRPVIGFPPEFANGFPRFPDGRRPQAPHHNSTPRPKDKEHTTPARKQASKPTPRRRPPYRTKNDNSNNNTLVRIDTCIVGDDSTCDSQLNEWCKAELSVSSCHCRPGFTRTVPRGPCTPIVTVGLMLKLDRLGEQRLVFNRNYGNPESEEYQLLEYEAKQALHSLFTKSSFSRVFMDVTVNKFQSAGSKVMVNATLQFEENDITRVPSVKRVLQHEVVNMINRRNSNIGESRLYVDGMLNSGLAVDDVNECNDATLNDCSQNGICENLFGTFRCTCKAGYTDKYPDTKWKSGRTCSACAPDYCNNRGDCRIENGQRECSCRGKYIGGRCDIDGEVLGVALGASVTAVIIIVLTLVCLCLWNRRWKREQHKAEVMSAHSVGSLGYLSKTSTLGTAYRVSVEDRLRWQHIADAMGNIYVQPDAPPPPKTPPMFASPPRVRSPSPPEENHYSHIQRPRSRGAMYGPPLWQHALDNMPSSLTVLPPGPSIPYSERDDDRVSWHYSRA